MKKLNRNLQNFNEIDSLEEIPEAAETTVEEVQSEERIEFKEIDTKEDSSKDDSKALNNEQNVEDTMSLEAVNEELNQIKSFFAQGSDN